MNDVEYDIALSLQQLFDGDDEMINVWMNSFNYHLGGVPSELIQFSEGQDSVLRYVYYMAGRA